jgi:hypothetical protein
MALSDKLKAQAAQLAQKAQEAGKAGQAKFEEVQARRRADGLLRDLGAAVFTQHVGRGGADASTEVERLIGELKAWESENGPLDDGDADDSAGETPKGV